MAHSILLKAIEVSLCLLFLMKKPESRISNEKPRLLCFDLSSSSVLYLFLKALSSVCV